MIKRIDDMWYVLDEEGEQKIRGPYKNKRDAVIADEEVAYYMRASSYRQERKRGPEKNPEPR